MLRYAKMRVSVVALLMVTVASACDFGSGTFFSDDSIFDGQSIPSYRSTLSRSDVIGTYEATAFELEGSDQLSKGATITIALAEDGSSLGRLFVPDWGEEGAIFEADLTGTWTFNTERQELELEHAAHTFLREIPLHAFFMYRRATLIGYWGGGDPPRIFVQLSVQ